MKFVSKKSCLIVVCLRNITYIYIFLGNKYNTIYVGMWEHAKDRAYFSTNTTRKTIFLAMLAFYFSRRVWPSEPNIRLRKYEPRWIFVIRLWKSFFSGGPLKRSTWKKYDFCRWNLMWSTCKNHAYIKKNLSHILSSPLPTTLIPSSLSLSFPSGSLPSPSFLPAEGRGVGVGVGGGRQRRRG